MALTILLVATLGGQPALSQVSWELDGNPLVGDRHSRSVEVESGRHTACAIKNERKRCRTFDVLQTQPGYTVAVEIGDD